MELRKNNPTVFCQDFITREVEDYKQALMWKSYWPVMERMVVRSNELKQPFKELIDEFGYADKLEGYPPDNTYVWLILEHIWLSIDYCRKEVVQARKDYKKLIELRDTITNLSWRLESALREQSELYEQSGFSRADYQSVHDVIEQASEHNYLHQSYLAEPLKVLAAQYDLKYWPSRADLLYAIAMFEEHQPDPLHHEIPEQVINGRASDIKDFVLAFDQQFDDMNGLPTGFRFSHSAMADIINVVLDVPPDRVTSGDAVRVVRNRNGSAQGTFSC